MKVKLRVKEKNNELINRTELLNAVIQLKCIHSSFSDELLDKGEVLKLIKDFSAAENQ